MVTCWSRLLLMLVGAVWFSVVSVTENLVLAVGVAWPMCTSRSPSLLLRSVASQPW